MVESVFTAIIEHLEWRYLQLRYCINSGKVKRSIGAIESSFQVNTFREFLRVVDYQNEDFVIEHLLEATDSDSVFWDIGANIGTHSCYIGQRAKQTIAIEPFPENAQQARENCRLNNIDATILEYALGASSGTATLAVPDSDESVVGVGTFSLQTDSPSSESIDVEVISGDFLIKEQNLPLPDVIKIDVEGGELDVLRGFHRGLQNARVVLVEVHPRHIEQEQVIELLESEGFSVRVLRQRNDEIHLLATGGKN